VHDSIHKNLHVPRAIWPGSSCGNPKRQWNVTAIVRRRNVSDLSIGSPKRVWERQGVLVMASSASLSQRHFSLVPALSNRTHSLLRHESVTISAYVPFRVAERVGFGHEPATQV